MNTEAYEQSLRTLQIALVRWQMGAIKDGQKVVVIFEGRDTAGKDGVIKRITEHLSIRATRTVALPKPSDREQGQWYFQRYVRNLPTAGELVIFNRSWYNRAGVERVMGYASPREQADFLRDVPAFEQMLVESGVVLLKYWLDISREEQKERLAARMADPLKALKVSPLDHVATDKWDGYSAARDEMLARTHTKDAPWWCVQADHKKAARLNVMRHMLHHMAPKALAKGVDPVDRDVLFRFDPEATEEGRLAR